MSVQHHNLATGDHPARPHGWLATFPPAYFAFVMATGIVSIASDYLGYSLIAHVLCGFTLLAYVTIWALQLARLVRYPRAMLADLTSHQRGAGFLTIVAATAIVGCECHLLFGADSAALVLWFFAIGLWIFLVYVWFAALVMVDPKPSLDRGIDGSWFLLTVSTQSLAILGTLVAKQFPVPAEIIIASLAFYLLGAMFYFWVISLVLLRWFFFPMDRTGALSPTYWINSGALSITTMAGACLMAALTPEMKSLAPFLTAFNMLFWATATWWIPLLFLVEAWRLFIQRFPLRYEPGYWSMVFPLGMYVACTWAYADSSHVLYFLKPIARACIFVAWTAWLITGISMVTYFLRWMRHRRDVR